MLRSMRRKRGFTMAELLIVVAIVAVLVAVAVPTFSNQLEKSRQATDLATLRQAYAAARIVEMDQMTGGDPLAALGTVTIDTGGGDQTYECDAYWYEPESGTLNRAANTDETSVVAQGAQKTRFGNAQSTRLFADTDGLPQPVCVYSGDTLSIAPLGTEEIKGTTRRAVLVLFMRPEDSRGVWELAKVTFAKDVKEGASGAIAVRLAGSGEIVIGNGSGDSLGDI